MKSISRVTGSADNENVVSAVTPHLIARSSCMDFNQHELSDFYNFMLAYRKEVRKKGDFPNT